MAHLSFPIDEFILKEISDYFKNKKSSITNVFNGAKH